MNEEKELEKKIKHARFKGRTPKKTPINVRRPTSELEKPKLEPKPWHDKTIERENFQDERIDEMKRRLHELALRFSPHDGLTFVGSGVVFIYKSPIPGIEGTTYYVQTATDLSKTPESAAQLALKELGAKFLRAFGISEPKKRNVKVKEEDIKR